MRLDKFLKMSRIMKRRTMAKQICDNCLVTVNGHQARPSKEVKEGDILEITVRFRVIRARVLAVPDRPVPPSAAESLYEIIEERFKGGDDPEEPHGPEAGE